MKTLARLLTAATLGALIASSPAVAGSYAAGATLGNTPIQIGTPVLSATQTIAPSATTFAAITCKTNRAILFIRGFGGQSSFDAGVRFAFETALDNGTTYAPLVNRTYSAIPGIHSAIVSGQDAGIMDVIDIQPGLYRVSSYAWGSTPTSGYGANVRILC